MADIIPKRIVIDTNVCLDLFVFKDPRWKEILDGLNSGILHAITRSDCKDEWLAVLKYPHLPVTAENAEAVRDQFNHLLSVATPDIKSHIVLPVCKDKDDQKFLEIARDTDADFLITKDKALLKLARRIKKLGLFSIETPEIFLQSLLKFRDKIASDQTKA